MGNDSNNEVGGFVGRGATNTLGAFTRTEALAIAVRNADA